MAMNGNHIKRPQRRNYIKHGCHVEAADISTMKAAKRHFKLGNMDFRNVIRINGILMSDSTRYYLERIKNTDIRDDDVWVCSYPRSGTHWLIAVAWLLNNDMDFMTSTALHLRARVPWFEYDACFSSKIGFDKDFLSSLDIVDEFASPRTILCHLPYTVLPHRLQSSDQPKIIYIKRNVKDVCVSLYHFFRNQEVFTDDFNTFCNLFLNNQMILAPYWDHVLSYVNVSYRKNVLILNYEDMKKDLQKVIYRISDFLGKSFTDQQIDKVIEHVEFNNMIKTVNTDGVHICRNGKSGEWSEMMTTEQIERFDQQIADFQEKHAELLKKCGIF